MTTTTLLRFLLGIAGAALLLMPTVAAGEAPLPADLPPYGDSKPLPIARIEAQTLDNGLTVWMVPRSGYPKVDVRLVVRGGTAVDPPGRVGLADVLADVLRGGTETRSSRQIAEELQAVGGELDTSASLDALFLSADGFATGFETVLTIVADVARNSMLPPNEVELAKANALQGLQASLATPEFEVDKRFAAAVFGEHPYTYSPGAGVDTFERGGRIRVEAAVRNEVTAASLLEIFYELDRLGTTLPTADELAQAKRYQGGLYLLRNQIQRAVVRTLAANWVQGLPVEALAEFVPKVEAVTAEDVKRVGRKHFASRQQVVVIGGDVDAIRADVELFGPVEVLE